MENKLFELVSKYEPKGDQPSAIKSLVEGIYEGKKQQVLLGATGTGKTFTIGNVIAQVNKPTLIFVHNKTLAGQLYTEFKELFPNNKVEYFVSNFDYYQPEAYKPTTDTYIEKTSMINEELEMLRMAAINAALQRRDTIIVASVACIFGSSNPEKYRDMFFTIRVNDVIDRKELLMKFVARQYKRNDMDRERGSFRVRGDVIEITLGYTDEYGLRIEMYDDEIERICEVDLLTGKIFKTFALYNVYPATGYAREIEEMRIAAGNIEIELDMRLKQFNEQGKLLEAQRLEQRCRFDLEALREFGVCSGIENYSMHIDGRDESQRPYNLFDYFPKDFLLVVDESHVSLPQVRGMYNGDRARKTVLVDYGFRLPSAMNNRPMKFEEFESVINQAIFVSATPGNYELEKVNNEVVQQIIRPTGLLDPVIDIRPTHGQIDDLCDEIDIQIKNNERTLITALTVKMAENLSDYFIERNYKSAYLHHETKTLERTEIIRDLRRGKYDILIGINLLREGLDIPEVSLICILDADKEGFLRSERSLIQIIGRAARNSKGRVIMYADKETDSMKKAILETDRRREIQIEYNRVHNITPTTIVKQIHEAISGKETKEMAKNYMNRRAKVDKKDKQKLITSLEAEMKSAAKVMDFERAAELRDIIIEMRVEN